ncbi:N-acetylmuramoyl-L-alanine amidase [Corynebacterium tapiri]|uniref:N-acetylmuramoyl-L-alanine amidase n=1 Tax=Corynebacterium tapiri TaxID=1448266 RepID=A0A5C4U390_9CORY|nr:N-acetylmuramoyl-L-alanine amidase [Corynebacterium tapiri]TNL96863.1 N-acetylmuramoyl-L-alanine amidase [Corynebacterium tapiri]
MEQNLHVGDVSARVAEARSTLARLGYLNGDEADISEWKSRQFVEGDKQFTEELADVLKAFQQSRGIFPSGALDAVTLRELRHASYELGARVLNYQPGAELVGDDVAQLQTQLQELGFYAHRRDGHFGEHTYSALMNYQLNSGLQDDGICGPKTLRALSLLGRRVRGGSPQAIRERERVRKAGPQLAGKRVVIDPALGGSNKGLTVSGRYGDVTEEELLWDLATRVEGRMIAAGMETILSRPRNDDPQPQERADIANAFDADVMISLHCDRYPNEKANGAATFYFGSEMGATSLTGETLAGFIQREIAARTDLVNCGNHARTWQLLRLTQMPTIEVVLGYLTNPSDVATLTDPMARDRIAEAIVVAVKRLYLLDEDHQPTGTYDFSELIAAERS